MNYAKTYLLSQMRVPLICLDAKSFNFFIVNEKIIRNFKL